MKKGLKKQYKQYALGMQKGKEWREGLHKLAWSWLNMSDKILLRVHKFSLTHEN